MARIIEKEVLSSDKTHYLKGKIYFPTGSAKGFFHVVHGMCEYIGRFDRLMQEMAELGYIAFGYDHLGHGDAAKEKNLLGFIAHEDGWKHLVDDVFIFGNEVRKMVGEPLPFYLMGHSMGSFVVRLTAAKYDHYDKLIVMGTGGPNPAAGAGITLCSLLKTFKGEKGYSNLIQKMAFGAYNKGFEDENDMLSWLSIDKANRDSYRRDPLCNYRFTNSAMQDLVRLNKFSNDKSWFGSINKKKPILLIAGAEDPVGDHGKGVKAVYDKLKASGANVKLKLYEGYRHEILNDACHDEVVADIARFIEE